MYILKYAWINITRKKGRNILIGVIISMITVGLTIGLTIYSSSKKLVESYKNKNPLEVSFTINPSSFRDKMNDSSTTNIEKLTTESIKNYADSSYVKDYYYTEDATLSSNDIKAIEYTKTDVQEERGDRGKFREEQSFGDFRITGYSDPSYITEFINGINKIKEGEMFKKDAENEVVISAELASENNLSIGSEITFYNPSNTDKTYTLKVVGIYEDHSDVTDNFMNMSAMNSSNKIYTSISITEQILKDNRVSMGHPSSLNAIFYLNNNSDLSVFEKEVRNKGLDTAYNLTTNEEEVYASIKPIQNVSNFSLTFLILLIIIGFIILTIINLIQIKERKYEIGVLRAIGMNKRKVALSFISEVVIIATFSLLIGTVFGSFLSQPVSNKMLNSEIQNIQSENQNMQQNFGKGGFENTRMKQRRGPMQDADYIDSLTVSIHALDFIKIILASLAVTTLSSMILVVCINTYEPNKILQNR